MRSLRAYYRGRDIIWWISHIAAWLITALLVAFTVNLVVPL